MSSTAVRLGLGANRGQFALLLLVNAFVGAMVGVERSALPLVGRDDFGLAAGGVTSFVAAFGAAKALANLFAGELAGRIGRRRTLLAGWLLALPVPALVAVAPSWSWVVGANALLGVSQGLAWTMTVLMKIDLVGPRQRGLATGLNEFAGYLAVGVAAFLAATVAEATDARLGPATLGLAFALTGLTLAAVVRDTGSHVRLEESRGAATSGGAMARLAVRQAGFANNANDALAWALVPLLLSARGADLVSIGAVAGAYPVTWSLAQLATGPLSDRVGRRPLVVGGMLAQAAAMWLLVAAGTAAAWLASAILWGLGTAMVYPALLAAAADLAAPRARARELGAYRFWRDAGLAGGALAGGFLASGSGLEVTLLAGAALTALSGLGALAVPSGAEWRGSG